MSQPSVTVLTYATRYMGGTNWKLKNCAAGHTHQSYCRRGWRQLGVLAARPGTQRATETSRGGCLPCRTPRTSPSAPASSPPGCGPPVCPCLRGRWCQWGGRGWVSALCQATATQNSLRKYHTPRMGDTTTWSMSTFFSTVLIPRAGKALSNHRYQKCNTGPMLQPTANMRPARRHPLHY